MGISIITPVFNDWACLEALVNEIALQVQSENEPVQIIAVNDCSFREMPSDFKIPNLIELTILDLCTNVGHQRAIVVGLCYYYEQKDKNDCVVVLDSDGEDKPEYILPLVKKCREEQKVVFAKRSKRSEGLKFRLFYHLYKILFRLLTGSSVSFGNFSCLPTSVLSRVCNDPNLWNHFSASLMKSNLPFVTIQSERGQRFFSESQMSFTKLILHGLSALSVYIEIIVVRFLKFSVSLLCLLFIVLVTVVTVKYLTDLAIPGWASFLFAIISSTLIIITLIAVTVVLQHMSNRNQPLLTPLSFYQTLICKMNKIIS